MRLLTHLFLSFLFSLQLAIGYGQTLRQKIETAFRIFETDPSMAYGITSLTVLNANTGEILFAKNEQTGLAPASTLKTVTSATAFHLLGPGYNYKTKLYYTGTIASDGTLSGDLVITGSGDPSLGSDRFEQSREEVILGRWLQAVKSAGIKRIEGRVVADDSLFGGQTTPSGWTWQNMGNYYGAGVSALNWRENAYSVTFIPGAKPGDSANIRKTLPSVDYLQLVNEVTTGKAGTGDQVYAYSAPYSSRVYIRGTYGIDLKKDIYFSLPDAAYDVAVRLQQAMELAGISTKEEPTTTQNLRISGISLPGVRTILDEYQSPTLGQIVYWFQQKSINLYGEALLKTIALQDTSLTDADNETKVVRDFWKNKLGIAEGSLNIIDGSGLSPQDRITTLTMARILASVKQEPWFGSFYESLPVYNSMKMKSGTIAGVLGYAGYHTSKTGTPFVFSLLVNNYEGSAQQMRQKMFKLLNVLK